MNTTKSIYEKIAEIQDEIGTVKKDAENPHFHNTYATYEKVLEVVNPVLRKRSLVILHSFEESKFEGQIGVITTIKDYSVQDDIVFQSTLFIPTLKDDPQAAGSAITYAKRYSILAMLGLGTEDDDGEKSVRRSTMAPQTATKPVNAIDDGLIMKCKGHGMILMTQRISEKTGKEYWSHIINGKHCFGIEKPPTEQASYKEHITTEFDKP